MLTEYHPADKQWWQWGNPDKRKSLRDVPGLKAFLEQRWHTRLDEVMYPRQSFRLKQIPEQTQKELRSIFSKIPDDGLSFDPLHRLKRSVGKSYHDMLKVFFPVEFDVVDFVLYPRNHEEVLYMLEKCSSHGIQVVPAGGGTSVTGGLDAPAGAPYSCCIDLIRMNRCIEIDKQSMLAHFECGITGPAIEETLNAQGLTLAHFPQSFEFSTLGGWLATRSAGQESSLYGKIEDMVFNLRVATPAGTIETPPYPRHAAGVDFNGLFVGSEGLLGILTEATMRIHALPKRKHWLIAIMPDFATGIHCLNFLSSHEVFPAVVRLSDGEETHMLRQFTHTEEGFFAQIKSNLEKWYLHHKGIHEPSLMMLRFDEHSYPVRAAVEYARNSIKKFGGILLSPKTGHHWEETRFDLPYLRDSMVAHRILIDTFETATTWRQAHALYKGVRQTLAERTDFLELGGLFMCHISHIYGSGACLYFFLLAPQERGKEMSQWQRLKSVVSDALLEHQGIISHHHGVGTDHQPWYLKQIGKLDRMILENIKKTVDPEGILNPGKLFDKNS